MIRGTKRKIDKNENVTRINPTVKASIHNRFDIEVVDAKTGKVKQKAYAENVICQAYWDFIFNWSTNRTEGWFVNICYGSGTGNPASTDTKLFSAVGYKEATTVSLNYRTAEHLFRASKKIVLDETTAIGVSFTEVGIGTSSKIYTHAMLRDMNGNQITLLKTDTDILTIVATVFLNYPEQFGSIESPYQMAYGTSKATLWWWLCGIDGTAGTVSDLNLHLAKSKPHGKVIDDQNFGSYTSSTVPTVDTAKKTITFTAKRRPVGEENIYGGARCVLLFSGYYKYDLSGSTYAYYPHFALLPSSEWIDPSVIKGETVGTGDGTTADFKTKFDFPYNAKVYVNGVEDATATVERIGVNCGANCYFDSIDIKDGKIYPQRSGTFDYSGGEYAYFYNSNHENGIAAFNADWITSVYCSEDGSSWSYVNKSSVSETLQKRKYWRLRFNTKYNYIGNFCRYNPTTANTATADFPLAKTTNIHFETPPPAGAVITIDYTTDVIAKDENHVFDLSLTIQLGEYTGE